MIGQLVCWEESSRPVLDMVKGEKVDCLSQVGTIEFLGEG